MLAALTLLLACQLAGEAIARLGGLSVPGPVIGLALLLMLLFLRARFVREAAPIDETPLGTVTAVILANLSLLFVPAGTGIVRQAAILTEHGPGLLVALVGSTVLALAVTAIVFRAVARWTGTGEQREPGEPRP